MGRRQGRVQRVDLSDRGANRLAMGRKTEEFWVRGDLELNGAGHQDGAKEGLIVMGSGLTRLKWCNWRCPMGYDEV